MPPAAISRSSTYFPKICGNIAFSYASAFPALLLALAPVAVACEPVEPEILVLEVRAFSLDADVDCKVLPNADVRLQALGPFPVTELGAEQVPFQATERTLTFPDETHGVEAQASDGNRSWFGYTDRRSEHGIDVLLWADGVSCGLFESSSYPASNAGQAIGYSPEAGVVLIAGGDTTLNAAGGSLVFESDTGTSSPVAPSVSFPEARAYATVTPFGARLLLAGGEDPLDPDVAPSAREARKTAVVYDPSTSGFTDVIELERERTRHAAVVMASGETLLVGGGQPRSDGSTAPVTFFEVVSPLSGRSTINGVVGLAHGRLEPVALRLDNGNLLVGGGYDPAGNPLASLEWFSPDASCPLSPADGACTSEPPMTLRVPRHHRAFVAMPGGGALTVGGCAPSDLPQTYACVRACGAGFGCPASEANASWIAPDGVVTDVRLAVHDDCPNLVPERVLLAPGSDGSPWLFAYDDDVDPPCRAIFRFDPWRAEFFPAALDLSRWPDPRAVLISLGPDAFVWLTDDDPPILAGTRTSSRGVLSQYEASLLVARDDPQIPVHLAPDRPPEASGLPVALFEPGGRLVLTSPNAPGESAVGVFVTDTLYDDVSVELDFDDALPVLLLGGFEVGGDGPCQWPAPAVPPLVAARRGTEVTTSDRDGNVFRCAGAPNGPVSVGVRAGVSATTLTSFVVRRL